MKGIEEIKDTLSDLLEAVDKFEGTLKGGKFDLVKFFAFAMDAYPKVQEAVEDFPTFVEEIKDLSVEESKDLTTYLHEVNIDNKYSGKVKYAIVGVLLSYHFLGSTFDGGKTMLEYWKGI
jgi:hypothetical protein